MSDILGPDGQPVKKPEEHSPVKVFMHPMDALNRAARQLQDNPRDRALRLDRDVVESLCLGLIDYAQQIKALTPKDAGVSDEQQPATEDPKP